MVAEKIVFSPLLDIPDRKLYHQANQQASDDTATKLLFDLASRANGRIKNYAASASTLPDVVLPCDLSYTLS